MSTLSNKIYDKKTQALYQLYISQPKISAITKKYSPIVKQENRSKSLKIIKVLNKDLFKSIEEVNKQIFKSQKKAVQLGKRGSYIDIQNSLQTRLNLRLQEQNNKIQRTKRQSLVKQKQLTLKRQEEERQKRIEQNIRRKQMQLINTERARSHYLNDSRKKSQQSFLQQLHRDNFDMSRNSRISSTKSQKRSIQKSFRDTQRNHRFSQLKQYIETKQNKYEHSYKKAFLLNNKISKKQQPNHLQRKTFQKEQKKMLKHNRYQSQKLPKISIQSKKISNGNIGQALIDKKLQKNQKEPQTAKPIKSIKPIKTKRVQKIPKKEQKQQKQLDNNNPQRVDRVLDLPSNQIVQEDAKDCHIQALSKVEKIINVYSKVSPQLLQQQTPIVPTTNDHNNN